MVTHMRIVLGTYYYRRAVFYRLNGWAPLPYVYRLYPRYGLFDTVFLAFMVDHIAERQYALVYYYHMKEPDFIAWRRDIDELARGDMDLKARLEAMDMQVGFIPETPPNPAYVPEDVQDIVLSPDVIDRLTPPKEGEEGTSAAGTGVPQSIREPE